MKFPKGRLQFGISGVSDIRFLLKAWDRQLISEGQPTPWPIRVDVMIDPRLTGEEVALNFTGSPEVLDRFQVRLREEGLKFSCDEIIPGFFTTCRVENEHF